jgi:hypothetical protein
LTFVEYINIFYSFQDIISSSIISEIVNPHRRCRSPCADGGRTAEVTRTAEFTWTAEATRMADSEWTDGGNIVNSGSDIFYLFEVI